MHAGYEQETYFGRDLRSGKRNCAKIGVLNKFRDGWENAKRYVQGAMTFGTHDSNARKCNDLGAIIYG